MADVKCALIIEDEPGIVDIFKTVAEMAGYTPEVICNGREAVERVAKHNDIPKVVLLDLHLPEVEGTEFLKKAREDEAWKNVAIIVITGDKDAADQLERRGKSEPRADQVYVKPMTVGQLLQLLQNAD